MCKEMEVMLEQLKVNYGNQIEIRMVHIDPDEKLFKQYRVVFVPTQIFLNAAGKEVFRHRGVFPQSELIKKLKELKFIQ
jgi:thioredoxin 1